MGREIPRNFGDKPVCCYSSLNLCRSALYMHMQAAKRTRGKGLRSLPARTCTGTRWRSTGQNQSPKVSCFSG